MKDKQIEKAIERLIEMYEEIQNDLLEEIASHFFIEDTFQNSDYWRLKKLEEMGLFNKKVVKLIAKKTGTTEKEVLKAFEEIGVITKDIPSLEEAYKNGRLRIDPKYIENNKTLQAIIKKASRNANSTLVGINQRIVQGTKSAYLNVIEEAYLKTTAGTHSYSEAIKEALNHLADRGITTLRYQVLDDNGKVVGMRNYDIESAVRRDILTEARNLNHELTEEIIKETEPDKLYLSEHLDCRPTHFPWQGTIINAEDLEEITGYGEVDGLGGINCRHYFEPYWGNEDGNDLKVFSESECDKVYFYTQHQRYLERNIRKWKRKAIVFDKSGMSKEYEYAKDKVSEWALRNQTFIELMNDDRYILRRELEREYVEHY